MSLAETLAPSADAPPTRRPGPRVPARLRRNLGPILWQATALVAVIALVGYFGHNVAENLRARGLASGFDFLSKEAGFAIGFSLIPFTEADTYGRAFVVGLLNTIFVAVVSMTLATVLGIVVGVARVSQHPPTAGTALAYVEGLRNIPLLLQVLFWHQLLINGLPGVRQSLDLGGWIFLNNRGLVLPAVGAGSLPVPPLVMAAAVIATLVGLAVVALRRAEPSRGRRVALLGLGALVTLEIALATATLDWERPVLTGFNFQGGVVLIPEFVALVVALVIYNAAFIAEIVRAGIESVGKGQREAAAALGLTPRVTMRLVVLPQALRVVIPPLANQYSHMLKASSLATVIGYPDLVNVFLGTTLNQTGRAVEIVVLTMAVYLVLSSLVAAFTSWFNARVALVER
jgi:general L-amino acid transport system permease protein